LLKKPLDIRCIHINACFICCVVKMTKTIKQVIQSSKAVHVFVVILIANVWTKKENIFYKGI